MKCPGQDSRYWQAGAIYEVDCPECGSPVEFFKDETTRKCRQCGHRFVNPKMDFGCATYCQYAEQCLGDLPPELIAQKEDLLKDRVAIEMKRHFGKDFKRIGHAGRLARYAEQIGKAEKGSLPIILTAAYLHDLAGMEDHEGFLKEDADRSASTDMAREILSNLSANDRLIHETCTLIQQMDSVETNDTVDIRVLKDAHRIAVLEDRLKETPSEQQSGPEFRNEDFLTESGRNLAKKILSSQDKT